MLFIHNKKTNKYNINLILYNLLYSFTILLLIFSGYLLLYAQTPLKINFFLIFFYLSIVAFPSLLPLPFIFLFGFVHDCLRGVPLGYFSLQYLLLYILLSFQRGYILSRQESIKFGFFIITCLLFYLSLTLLNSFINHQIILPVSTLFEMISTVIFYPFIAIIMKILAQKYHSAITDS